jgi:hypothetical protein
MTEPDDPRMALMFSFYEMCGGNLEVATGTFSISAGRFDVSEWEGVVADKKQHRWWIASILAIVIFVTLTGVLAYQLQSGIRISVENTGTMTLKSVVLHVTGASYQLGDISPGDSASTRVNPIGESHLEVEFVDADGQTQRLNAGGYFESGYRGAIRVEIKDGQINKFDDNTNVW